MSVLPFVLLLSGCSGVETGPYSRTLLSRFEPALLRLASSTEEIATGSVIASSGQGSAILFPDDHRLVLTPPEDGWDGPVTWSLEGTTVTGGTLAFAIDEQASPDEGVWSFPVSEGVGIRGESLGLGLIAGLETVGDDESAIVVATQTVAGCWTGVRVPAVQRPGGWMTTNGAVLEFNNGSFEFNAAGLTTMPSNTDVPRFWATGRWTGAAAIDACQALGPLGTNCSADGQSASGVLIGQQGSNFDGPECL